MPMGMVRFILPGRDGDFDADGDGVISMEEAKVNPQLVKIFDDLDTDGNGEISKEEFSKVQ